MIDNKYDENGKHFDGYVELIDKLKTLFRCPHRLKGRRRRKRSLCFTEQFSE